MLNTKEKRSKVTALPLLRFFELEQFSTHSSFYAMGLAFTVFTLWTETRFSSSFSSLPLKSLFHQKNWVTSGHQDKPPFCVKEEPPSTTSATINLLAVQTCNLALTKSEGEKQTRESRQLNSLYRPETVGDAKQLLTRFTEMKQTVSSGCATVLLLALRKQIERKSLKGVLALPSGQLPHYQKPRRTSQH